MIVACLGDIMLDVIVDVPEGLVADDDTPARITVTAGGQAANVARWAREYGAHVRLLGPRSPHATGRIIEESLTEAAVEVHGPVAERSAAVVSVLSRGSRSLASDAGTSSWLDDVRPGAWLEGADWLFVSGYAVLRAPRPRVLLDVAAAAHRGGTRVAVDLSSAAMIRAYGPSRFRRVWQAMRPEVVLANEQEWAATHGPAPARETDEAHEAQEVRGFGAGGTTVLVLKQGAHGCSFVIDGVADHRPAPPGPVVDVTGAGDALAAGFLVGGPDLAMTAAARCVAGVGAQPRAAR